MSVVKVQKLKPGWEPIPNAFASDLRLSEDAVAVGLWLSIKPEGWKVRPTSIQSEFSRRPGKIRGKDWWSRVSGELKDAGYLHLNAGKDAKGQFSSSWDFCVFGLGEFCTDVCSADAGTAVHGSTDSGSSNLSNQNSSYSSPIKHTQHNAAMAVPAKLRVCGEVDALLSGISLSAGLRKLVEKELMVLDPKLQVSVAREFISHRSSIRNPVPWMRRVCSDTLFAGEFIPAAQLSTVNNSAIPENHTCELEGCKKYAVTLTSRGWRCAQHIAK